MDAKEFLKPSGELVDIKGSDGLGYKAFIPAKLPVKIEFDSEALALLEKAGESLGKLDGMGKYLTRLLNINIRFFIRPYLHGEAVLSSRIEGTRSTLLDVLNAEIEPKAALNAVSEDLFEVLNYVRAQDYGIKQIEHSNSIDVNLIKTLHRELLQHVRGETSQPGNFRAVQNYISKFQTGQGIAYATYVPPPPEKVVQLVEDLIAYMDGNDDPPLVKIALMHYQFEAIHPFLDGNGRIGRLLIILYLIKEGVIKEPLLYMSEYFEANRQTYYSLLLEVSKSSDYLEWIKFFLTGVAAQAEKAIRKMESVALYYEEKGGMIKSRYSKSTLELFGLLFSRPVITLPYAARALKLKYPTVKKAAMRLVNEGILRRLDESGKKKRPARFIAWALYGIYTGGSVVDSGSK